MPNPKNYTTTIPVRQTVGEVLDLLARHGAAQVMLRYDEQRNPVGVAFVIKATAGSAMYHLPVDAQRVYLRLQSAKAANPRIATPTRDQAHRVAWRTLEDWLEAQLDMIANGLVDLEEVMLPFRLLDGQTTVYQALKTGRLALPGNVSGSSGDV